MTDNKVLIIAPFGLINEKDHPVDTELSIILKGGPKFPVEMTGPHRVVVKRWNPTTTEGSVPANCVELKFSKEDHYLADDSIAVYRIALVSELDYFTWTEMKPMLERLGLK